MNTIYTLISYTPGESGWTDRCGDWIPGKDSEMEIHYFNDKKQVGEALGYAQFNNSDGENILLINGLNPDDWHCILSDEEGKALEDEFFDIDNIAFEKREQLRKDKEQRIAEEKIRKEQEQKAAELRAKMKQEQAEKAQLTALMAKYGKQ